MAESDVPDRRVLAALAVGLATVVGVVIRLVVAGRALVGDEVSSSGS